MRKNNPTISYSLEAWKTLIGAMSLSPNEASWHEYSPQERGEVTEMSALAWRDLAEAVNQYRNWQETPIYRAEQFPILWQEEKTRLLDLGGEGNALLLVPSMINRHEILHMPGRASLADYFKANGFRVYLLDWGLDGGDTSGLHMSELQRRLALASARIGDAALLGYCLGGTLAHLTHLPEVKAQVLLGVPWKFQHDQGRVGQFAQTLREVPVEVIRAEIEKTQGAYGVMPALYVDYLFAALNPLQFVQKFRHRGGRDDLELFDALEDWLNSGVNLPIEVVKILLLDWFREDKLLEIDGIKRPTLAVFGKKDHIAPPKSCQAIALSGENVQLLEHNAGHVGLLVGKQAQSVIWPRLAEYFRSHFK